MSELVLERRYSQQGFKALLNLGFLLDKLVPVLVQSGWVAAAQEHVFPLLHLDLELQVGLVDLTGGQHFLGQ